MRKYMLMAAAVAGFVGAVWGNIAPLPTTKPATTTSKPATTTATAPAKAAAAANAPAKG
jgi:hypothetical protein